ncbi:MAG TPA: hypothetical protein DG753_09795 [Clostridium sp.]|nr:hypothetical protein [Clostridium sp.]
MKYKVSLMKRELFNKKNITECPKCKAKHFIKYGFFNGIQRYKCKECNHTFSKVTDSLCMYSKKDFKVWLKFIEMTFDQVSLRACARYLKISVDTAFTWRHKLLYALSEIDKIHKFKGYVHMEATRIGANNKGNYKKNKPNYINGSKRLFRFLDADNIEIIGVRSSENEMILVPNRILKWPYSKRTIEKEEHYKSKVGARITSKTYIKSYKSNNIIKIAVKHNNKLPEAIKIKSGYTNMKEYRKNNIYPLVKDNLHSDKLIKNLNRNINCWLECYRGVSTKYLQQYFNLIVQKNNINNSDYLNNYEYMSGSKYSGYLDCDDKNLSIENSNSELKNYIIIFKKLITKSKFIRKIDIFNIDIFESKLIYNY